MLLTVLCLGPSLMAGSSPLAASVCSAAVSLLLQLLHNRHGCQHTTTPVTGLTPNRRVTSRLFTRDWRPVGTTTAEEGKDEPACISRDSQSHYSCINAAVDVSIPAYPTSLAAVPQCDVM